MKLFVFDIDGTLTETTEIDAVCYVKAIKKVLNLKAVNTSWETYTYATHSGIAMEISQRQRGSSISESELKGIEKEFTSLLEFESQRSIDMFAAISGARKAIETFRKGEDQAISFATGGWEKPARLKLRLGKIEIEGLPMATASDSPEREEIMQISLERAKEQYGRDRFEEIVYFGDAPWDYYATQNLNWKMIGIGKNSEKLKKLGVESAFEDFNNIESIIQTINAK